VKREVHVTSYSAVSATVKNQTYRPEVLLLTLARLLGDMAAGQPGGLKREYNLNFASGPEHVTLQELHTALRTRQPVKLHVAGNVLVHLVAEMEAKNPGMAREPFRLVIENDAVSRTTS
jgi:hypothetical protein